MCLFQVIKKTKVIILICILTDSNNSNRVSYPLQSTTKIFKNLEIDCLKRKISFVVNMILEDTNLTKTSITNSS